jgi:hypothetical protein
MITFECAWCEGELAIETLDADRVECPDCGISIELAADAPSLPVLVAA